MLGWESWRVRHPEAPENGAGLQFSESCIARHQAAAPLIFSMRIMLYVCYHVCVVLWRVPVMHGDPHRSATLSELGRHGQGWACSLLRHGRVAGPPHMCRLHGKIAVMEVRLGVGALPCKQP